MTAKVTVVIPVLNGAGEIAQQLAALAAQDYKEPFEVVVADNGSTDGTPAVVQSWAGRMPHLRLVDASSKAGPAHARNVGTRAGRGDLVLYTDADDVVAPTWVSAMVRASGDAALLLGRDEGALEPAGAGARSTGPQFLPWGRGGNLGVSRAAFEAVGGWDEERRVGEDVEFCWRVQLAGFPSAHVPDALTVYRRPSGMLALARHQFGFGKRAPGLYREFRRHGAGPPQPLRAVRRVVWLLTRAPYLLLGPRLRRRWVLTAAAAAGRSWGMVDLYLGPVARKAAGTIKGRQGPSSVRGLLSKRWLR